MLRFDYLLPIAVSVLMLADMFFMSLPVQAVLLLMLAFFIVRCNLYENIFLLLLYYPVAFGFILNARGIFGLGGALSLVGMAILFWWMLKGGNKLNNFWKTSLLFCLLIIWFGLSALTTVGGTFAMSKWGRTALNGFTALLAFSFLFSNLKKIDTVKLGLCYLVYSACLLRWAIQINGIPGPSGLFDIAFLRFQTIQFLGYEPQSFHVDYQNLGFYCVLGSGYALIADDGKSVLRSSIIILLSTVMALYSGSRQAIITMFTVILLWIFMFRKGRFFIKLLFSMAFVAGLFYVVPLLIEREGVLNSVVSYGYLDGGGRGEWLSSGIEQFKMNPLTGVGFGRYRVFGRYGSYPHNIIIELLCETGIYGLLFAVALSSVSIWKCKKHFPVVLFIFWVFLMRSMASDSLAANITLFSIIFSLFAFESGPVRNKVLLWRELS
ncbi:MAG: O-antigen ligase family protein [Bacteroidales bacterium]|nr:O-antigen ligase family protein [Bacteroidales bacterium]